MKKLDQINLKQAEASFAVANTPLFLIHKLQSDPAVREIVDSSISGKAILQALKVAIRRKPRTLTGVVRPYVYLAALSQRQDESSLKEASQFDAKYFDWFDYITNVLLETRRAASLETFLAPSNVTPTVNTRTRAPITSSTIQVDH